MAVHPLKLFLTHPEPLFLFNEKVQQQATSRFVFNAFFQLISKSGEILAVNKSADVFHSTHCRVRPLLHSMRPVFVPKQEA